MKTVRLFALITIAVVVISLLLVRSSEAGGPVVYYQGGYYYNSTHPDVVIVEKHHHYRPKRYCCCYSCWGCCHPRCYPPPRAYYRPYPRYHLYAPTGGWYLNFGFGERF